ncbi:MAG: TonB-dependent receptor [Proteobacteria bacterium]|nr:TonB-dependent receptor [Pseudomonadota bacterium]
MARAVRIAIAATLGATAATASMAQNTGNDLVLTEVTVTAQRTSASLQDVPISVTALSAEDIDRQQINNTLDVISKVPNLVGSNNVGLGSATSFFLRGVGQDESLATSDPAIGTYVDGVYIARQINNNAFLYDMDRIEVLRGPQGTLYGRNTSGGAVKVITRKPEDELKGYVDLSYGDYDAYSGRAMINAPISDTLSLRLNGFVLGQDEGYIKNLTTKEEIWAPEGYGARAQLRFQPNDDVDFTLAVEYADEEGTGLTGSDFARNTDRNLFTVVSGLRDQFAETDQTAVTLGGTFKLGSVTVESITGWRDLNQRFLLDLSDAAPSQYILPHKSNHEQLSQEFVFSGEAGRVDWLAGVFYMDEKNRTENGDELFLFGGAVAANFRRDLRNDNESYGIFAEATFNLNDQWSFTAGGRQTEEKKTVNNTQFFVAPGGGPRNVGGNNYPGVPGGLVRLWGNPEILANGEPTKLDFSEFTPKLALQYRHNDDLLTYASYTEGFKSGGWNARVTDVRDFVAFQPETVKSMELGVKSEWMDDRLRANFTVTINAAEVKIDGFEVELAFVAADGLDFFASLGQMDNEYKKLSGADFPKSNQVKRTPEMSYQLGFNWDVAVPGLGGSILTTGSFSHQDEYYNGLKNAAVELAPAIDLFDLSVGFRPDSGRWALTASCKNCGNEEYYHSTLNFGTLGFATQFPGLPRTWKLGFRYNFGAL